MMKRIVLATRNAHKTREFSEILSGEFPVIDLCGREEIPEVIESGRTFEENARLKAEAVAPYFPDSVIIADDSGLEVEALKGEPGIFSARYAGAHASDAENVAVLLKNLEAVEEERRRALFRCVLVAMEKGRFRTSFEGILAGRILGRARGTNGFGYDPVFQPDGCDCSLAEMPAARKNEISHRARAISQLRDYLRER